MKLITKRDLLSILKFFNVILLILFLFSMISLIQEEMIELQFIPILLIFNFILPPFAGSLVLSSIEKHHHFFEWDIKERKRKSGFLNLVTIDVYFFLYLSAFVLGITISNLKYLYQHTTIEFYLGLFYGILFLLNGLFPITLHGYNSELEIKHSELSDKPDNWKSSNSSKDRYKNPPKVYGL